MTREEAKTILSEAKCEIAEEKRLGNETGWQLRLCSGAVVNVFDKGSYNVQGKNKASVKRILDGATSSGTAGRKVFVVYGHDELALQDVEVMLRRWGLEPLILGRLPSGGHTVIEKLEHYQKDVAFGVVLATPDDEGHPKGKPDEMAFRARQNVVLELGMLLASPNLGRSRVAILLKKQHAMERPSDIQGLIYIPFDDRVTEAGTLLAKELAAQGIPIAVEDL